MHPTWRNTTQRYGRVAIALHWLIALGIIGLLSLGTVMVRLATGSALQFALYQWHKSFGMLVLALSLARLAWRLANPVPPLPATLRRWEQRLARAAHVAFYVLMIAVPFSGWMLVSASVWRIPTVVFGWFTLPHLPVLATLADRAPVEAVLQQAHEALAIATALLLALHVAGALKHHFVDNDDTLERMLPLVRRRQPRPPAAKETGR